MFYSSKIKILTIVYSIMLLYSHCALLSQNITQSNSITQTNEVFQPFLDIDDQDVFNDINNFNQDSFENDIFDLVDEEQGAQIKALPQDIITLLETVGGIELIKESFFLQSNTFNKRSLLDQSLFLFQSRGKNKKWSFGVDAFYTHTNRSFFTKKHSHLSSYVALTQETLLEKLENTITTFKAFNPALEFDIRSVFCLFTHMTVEERHAGFMFNALYNWSKAYIRIATPWYYLERNFFLTKQEKKKVEEKFGVAQSDEQEEFQKDHLVSDKFGLGDTRIEYACHILKTNINDTYIGVQATIPTAFRFFKGPNGSLFKKSNCFPQLNTNLIFNVIEDPTIENQQRAFDTITSLGLQALDRVAANLLDAPLGNGNHCGIGGFVKNHFLLGRFLPNHLWARSIIIDSHTSLEYLLPSHEKRFYINKVDTAGFENRNFDDETQSTDNLNFLTQELVARYFLRAFNTRVQPGVIFRWASQASFQGNYWGWKIGSDLWIQSVEKTSLADDITEKHPLLDIQKAKGFMAYQNNLFGGIVYKVKRPTRNWFVSVNGEQTYSHSGIGSVWGISLGVKTYF